MGQHLSNSFKDQHQLYLQGITRFTHQLHRNDITAMKGKAFALLDKNNDGVIDHEEWRQAEVVSTWFSSGQDVRPQSQKDIQRIEAREPIALSRTPTAHLTE